MRIRSIFVTVTCLSLTGFVSGQDKPELRQKETAAFAQRMAGIPDGGVTGEGLAWYLSADLGPILRNCQSGSDDWMAPAESVLNMLAEATTTEISKEKQPETFDQSREIARQGGEVAGNTRKEIEAKTGKKIVSPLNAKSLKAN